MGIPLDEDWAPWLGIMKANHLPAHQHANSLGAAITTATGTPKYSSPGFIPGCCQGVPIAFAKAKVVPMLAGRPTQTI